MQRAQRGGAVAGAGQIEEVELVLRDAAVGEDVPGHAASATQAHGIAVRIPLDQQRLVDGGEIHVLIVRGEERRVVVLRVGVVAPGVVDVALAAQHRAVVAVLVVAAASATLDVAAADRHVGRDRRAAAGNGRGIRIDLGLRAQRQRLLRAHQRIAAVDVVVAADRIVRIREDERRRGRDHLV